MHTHLQRPTLALASILGLATISNAQIGYEVKGDLDLPQLFYPLTSPWGTTGNPVVIAFDQNGFHTIVTPTGLDFFATTDSESLPLVNASAVGDPSGTSIPYVAIGNPGTLPQVWKGSSTTLGDFDLVSVLPSPLGMHDARFADQNGDGLEDLMVFGEDSVSIYEYDSGLDDFTLTLIEAIPSGVHRDSAFFDLDTDGVVDVVAILERVPGQVYLYEFDILTGFGPVVTLIPPTFGPLDATSLEGMVIDGAPHVVMSTLTPASTRDTQAFEVRNGPVGIFRGSQPLPSSASGPRALQAADVDGDGLEDLIVGSPLDGLDGARILYQTVGGPTIFGFEQLTSLGGNYPMVADFDGDGRTDLALGRQNLGIGLANVRILDQRDAFLRGDVNNDSVLNISDMLILGNYLYSSGPAPVCLDSGDVDDDGDLDINDLNRLGGYIYYGLTPPAFPFPDAGGDPTPDTFECL